MRITNRQITSNYIFNANKQQEDIARQYQKCYTGRAFTRISENVTTGKKALEARTMAYRNAQYLKNVSTASEQVTTAEGALTAINDQLQNVKTLTEKAVNGTNSDETSRKIFAATLEETKAAIVDNLNSNHAGKYILGGTNNQSEPFAVDTDGDITFNGVKIDTITQTDGVYFDANGDQVPLSNDTYIDVGKGLRLSGDDFDESSALKVSFSGCEWTGFGTSPMTYKDSDGNEVTEDTPNNVYQIMTQMQKALDDGDMERLSALNDHLDDQYDNLLTGIAKLGIKAKSLETTKTVLTDQADNIANMQQDLEGINDTTEIVKLEEYQYSWQLTMKFGSTVLPQSLMDYL